MLVVRSFSLVTSINFHVEYSNLHTVELVLQCSKRSAPIFAHSPSDFSRIIFHMCFLVLLHFGALGNAFSYLGNYSRSVCFTRHLVCLFYWANLPRGKEHEQDSGPMRGAPPYPIQKDQRDRPQHRELRALLFSMSIMSSTIGSARSVSSNRLDLAFWKV